MNADDREAARPRSRVVREPGPVRPDGGARVAPGPTLRPHRRPSAKLLVYLWAPFANLLWYAHTVVMASLSFLIWPFDRSGDRQFWCARWWCRLVAWSIFARIRVHGAERVRRDRSYVYVANHASLIDTPALFAYLPHPFRIVAKRSLFHVPFMGWHLWTAGHFPIDRGDARKTARSLRRVIDGVRNGRSLAGFPEGTRTRDGRLQAFQPGLFRIALKAGVPVVPVTILGTFALLPRTTLAPRPGPVDVIVGEPIATTDYGGRGVDQLIERTRAVIQQTLDAGPPGRRGSGAAAANAGAAR